MNKLRDHAEEGIMKIKQYEKYRKSFPYYEVQYYDRKSRVWREIQKRFGTEGQARKHGMAIGISYRVVEITRESRRII